MTISAIPGIRDPAGYFISHNKRLVDTMVRRPQVARMVRAILEGIDLWASERGIDPALVDADAVLQRDGRIVIRLREGNENERE